MRLVPHIRITVVIFFTACSSTQYAALGTTDPISEGSGTLIVEIEGLRNTDGRVALSVFGSATGFPDDTASVLMSATQELNGEETPVFRFENLQHGQYAISVLHDENGNGELDTNLLGMPSEGFGFSNDPGIGFGAPSYESCRFRFEGPDLTLRIVMKYL